MQESDAEQSGPLSPRERVGVRGIAPRPVADLRCALTPTLSRGEREEDS